MTRPVSQTHRSEDAGPSRQVPLVSSWIIWVLATATALPVFSQPGSWEVLVPSDSLHSREVLSLAVEKSGVTWIGTNQGGVRLEEGGSPDWVGALDGKAIRDVAVDQENIKWFATDDGVLSFDDQDWTRYGMSKGLVSREVTSIAVDAQNVKWFGTKGGLSRFNGLNWRSFFKRHGLPDSSIIQVTTGSEGDLWLATRSGVAHYDGEQWEGYPASEESAPWPTSIAVDQHGVVWCTSFVDQSGEHGSRGAYVGGLWSYDGTTWDSFETHESETWLGRATSVFVDPANEIWVAANQTGTNGEHYTNITHYDGTKFTGYRFSDSDLYARASFAVDGDGAILVALGRPKSAVYRSAFRVNESTRPVRSGAEKPWFARALAQSGTPTDRVLLTDVRGPRPHLSVKRMGDDGFLLSPGGQWLVRTDISGDIRWTRTLEDGYIAGMEEAPQSGSTVLAAGPLRLYQLDRNGERTWERELQSPLAVQELDERAREWSGSAVKSLTPVGLVSAQDGSYIVSFSVHVPACCDSWWDRHVVVAAYDSSGTLISDSIVGGLGSSSLSEGLLPGPRSGLSVLFGRQYFGDFPDGYGCHMCQIRAEHPFVTLIDSDGVAIWHYSSPVKEIYYEHSSETKVIPTSGGMYLFMGNVGTDTPSKVRDNVGSDTAFRWRHWIVLAMLSDRGELMWEKILSHPEFSTIGWDLAPHPGGGAILLGTFDGRMWMSHVDAEGRVVRNWNLGMMGPDNRPRIWSLSEGVALVFGYRTEPGILDVREVALVGTDAKTDLLVDPLPWNFELYPNYPNPFNASTTISFTTEQEELVSLRIFNLQGALVRELVNSVLPAGAHTLSFDAENWASGLYFCRLESGGKTLSRKMVLLR